MNGNQKKDLVNRHYEAVKLTDLEYLKLNGGPFTTPEEVEEFMKKTKESKEKNKRLYTEVRYAKNTCMSLKHSAAVFRLKRSYTVHGVSRVSVHFQTNRQGLFKMVPGTWGSS